MNYSDPSGYFAISDLAHMLKGVVIRGTIGFSLGKTIAGSLIGGIVGWFYSHIYYAEALNGACGCEGIAWARSIDKSRFTTLSLVLGAVAGGLLSSGTPLGLIIGGWISTTLGIIGAFDAFNELVADVKHLILLSARLLPSMVLEP